MNIEYNQCSTICKGNQFNLIAPYIWDKKKELNIDDDDNCFIEKIIAFGNNTIVIINQFKN